MKLFTKYFSKKYIWFALMFSLIPLMAQSNDPYELCPEGTGPWTLYYVDDDGDGFGGENVGEWYCFGDPIIESDWVTSQDDFDDACKCGEGTEESPYKNTSNDCHDDCGLCGGSDYFIDLCG